MSPALEFRLISQELEVPLSEFFSTLSNEEYLDTFHPHAFTPEAAHNIARYCGKDMYYVALSGKTILAYGILRGWDEGFDVPSLGIVIHPNYRNRGLGKAMMLFLHSSAKYRGAKKIRLKVYPRNTSAIRLYKDLGYVLSNDLEDGQHVGLLEL